jgi:hypothetical protein
VVTRVTGGVVDQVGAWSLNQAQHLLLLLLLLLLVMALLLLVAVQAYS